MSIRSGRAQWEGDLRSGNGTVGLGSGAFEGQFNFGSRFEEGVGTNPEELIAAAHASCFSMAFSNMLSEAGHVPTRVTVTAKIHLERVDGAPTITRSHLDCEAVVPGVDDATFQEIAAGAKAGCPVSRALGAIEIDLDARLVEG